MVGESMDLLLHMCCGPCSTYSSKRFRELGFTLTGYFDNPNIHPYQEFQRRLETLEQFCMLEAIPLHVSKQYNLESYLREIMAELENRCGQCYRIRLEATARKAAEQGISHFSTTLAVSPYQNHDLLQAEGLKAGQKYGVSFVYEDLRPGFRESAEMSRALGLYRQPYCGCIFSEKERYYKEKV
jgi:epoxyqueuosine reductase